MFIEIILIGIIIGLVSGGSLNRLGKIELRLVYIFFIVYLMQACIDILAPRYYWGGYPYMHVFSYFLLFFALLRNIRIPGIIIILFGTVLNFLVIIFNKGKMPVRADVIPRQLSSVLTAGSGGTHGLLVSGTKLKFLADIFYLPLPYQHQLLSVGDIIINIGILVLLIKVLRRTETM